MRSPFLLAGLLLFAWATLLPAAEPVGSRPFDTTRRVPFNGSRLVGSPDPPAPFVIKPAYPRLKLLEPVAIARVPGMKSFLVAGRPGTIHHFAQQSEATAAAIGDLQRTIYGLAPHPQFAQNGKLYVMSIVDPTEGAPTGSRVSQFQVDRSTQPWKLRTESEVPLVEWPSGGHNGGNLAFGHDGFLYIACGDGSGIADERQTGQKLDDLLACLLRIDVDRHTPGKNYAIPADNPFVQTPGARPEVFAYGLRQLWKFSFDRQTGDLWGGDVGQDLWEMVLQI